MRESVYDLAIIGAGPAGLTASLYAGRYRLKTLLFEKLSAGGQIIFSPTIENFPAFPGGISTQELIDRLQKQVAEVDIAIRAEEVLAIKDNSSTQSSGYLIETNDSSYETKSIIIASGAQPKHLDVEGEKRLIGRGVSYCGTCDGPLFKNKDIVVIGGGDRATEEALFLSGYAKMVTVVHRRDTFRASKILEEKTKHNPKIKFMLNTVVIGIEGQNKVEAVKIKDVKTNAVSQFPCEGVFIFVGIEPNTVFLKGQILTDEKGFILTNEELESSKEGIFACGDCRKKSLYQVVNACGEGAVAAHAAQGYLLKL